jgi:hypothetical protein
MGFMNTALERTWKEAVWSNLSCYPGIYHEELTDRKVKEATHRPKRKSGDITKVDLTDLW